MTIKVDIREQQVAALTAKTRAQGLTLEDWFRELAAREVPETSAAHLQKTSSDEWILQFDAWVDSRDPNTSVLSDEAMGRESIYPDRG